MRKLIIITFLIIICFVSLALVPWKQTLERQIIAVLESHGFTNVSLHVSGVGLHSIVLDDIAFSGENAIRLKNVKIDYTFSGLRARQLESLTILEPSILIRQQKSIWVIAGLENIKSSPSSKPINITLLNEMLEKLPFNRLIIEKGSMSIQADSWKLSLPLNITFEKSLQKISYKGNAATFSKGNIEAKTGDIEANLNFENVSQTWKGDWHIDQIATAGTPTPVPALAGGGTLNAKENKFNISGALQSKDELYKLNFDYNHSFDKEIVSVLSITSAQMPWKQGNLRLTGLKIPVSQDRALSMNIQVDRVSVDELLGAMTGQKVNATGYVSGSLPVTIGTKGNITVGRGKLDATGPGTINMPPDAIPGDNKQVALARDILADLNYNVLSISTNSDDQGDMSVAMKVEGSNPAVYNGRDVKLNVNLTGDVLDFIQQNVMLFTKPQNLWEHNRNE